MTFRRVARAFWNKGFASAILPAFVQWAFNTWYITILTLAFTSLMSCQRRSYLIRVEAHVYCMFRQTYMPPTLR